jgi:hypothetical protein
MHDCTDPVTTLTPRRSSLRPAAAMIRYVVCGLLGLVAGSVALAQGQPSPALAPLQPKVPQQPNLPTGPKSIPLHRSRTRLGVCQAIDDRQRSAPSDHC